MTSHCTIFTVAFIVYGNHPQILQNAEHPPPLCLCLCLSLSLFLSLSLSLSLSPSLPLSIYFSPSFLFLFLDLSLSLKIFVGIMFFSTFCCFRERNEIRRNNNTDLPQSPFHFTIPTPILTTYFILSVSCCGQLNPESCLFGSQRVPICVSR